MQASVVQSTVNAKTVDQVVDEACVNYRAESYLDALMLAAGPGSAIVCGEDGIDAVIRWDVERGAPVEDVPASGWCS